jgi:HIT domain
MVFDTGRTEETNRDRLTPQGCTQQFDPYRSDASDEFILLTLCAKERRYRKPFVFLHLRAHSKLEDSIAILLRLLTMFSLFSSCFRSSKLPEEPAAKMLVDPEAQTPGVVQLANATTQPGCTFCSVEEHPEQFNLVYEDELLVAFNDRKPSAKHHLLVCPKTHVGRYSQVISSLKGRLISVFREREVYDEARRPSSCVIISLVFFECP